MPARNDLALLGDAARHAGRIALRHFRRDPETWEKPGDEGPVTVADLEVNAYLEEALRAARPDYGWMSEESEDRPQDRSDDAPVFIVDPIDGTRAFIEGTSAFAHALSVVEAGRVTAAVVYLPAQDRLFAASLAGGATLNGVPIRVTGTRDIANGSLLATRATIDPAFWPGGTPEMTRGYRPSLAYRLCLVAQGRFDAFVTFRDTWEWDTAAATLIAEEAGARVTDASGQAIRFNSRERRHPGCLVANPELHSALLSRRLAAPVGG